MCDAGILTVHYIDLVLCCVLDTQNIYSISFLCQFSSPTVYFFYFKLFLSQLKDCHGAVSIVKTNLWLGLHKFDLTWWGKGDGKRGWSKHLPLPSVQQRSYVAVKSRHKPGHRHASPNRPNPKVSHLLWSCCQKLHFLSRRWLYTLLPHWAPACLCLSPSSSGSKRENKMILFTKSAA